VFVMPVRIWRHASFVLMKNGHRLANIENAVLPMLIAAARGDDPSIPRRWAAERLRKIERLARKRGVEHLAMRDALVYEARDRARLFRSRSVNNSTGDWSDTAQEHAGIAAPDYGATKNRAASASCGGRQSGGSLRGTAATPN